MDGFAPDRDPIKQSKAACDYVRGRLEALTGRRGIEVRGMVLYPGWWVDGPRGTTEIWVLAANALAKWLNNEATRLTPADIALYADRLQGEFRQRQETLLVRGV